ncbi:MAG TPA: hypothetical protein VI524_11825 [Anaerolineales bacterium]|nr:hypothetical protein [Anaerolineales bacterium]
MVHALSEIRRVLVEGGLMIDLRPILDHWPIEVASARGTRQTGRFQDLPLGTADDQVANRSMAQAEQDGWFIREQEHFFLFSYSWDTPSEMEEWIKTEWEDFLELDQETKKATRSAWSVADADSRIRIQMKMVITRWKKLP